MNRFLQKFLVLTVTLLITLGMIELGLRVLMPIDYRPPATDLSHAARARDIIYQASDIPDLDYELVPNIEVDAHGVLVRTNSYGMRDEEPDPSKIKKIVVLGDSFTFGDQVPQETIFSYTLEEELQLRGYQYDVLNLAVSAYGTKDEVITLRYKGMIWKPEIIVVGYVLNDPEVEPIHQLPAYFREPSWWQYSHVLRLFARGKKRFDILTIGGGNYYQYLHNNRASWTSVVNGFENIKDMARENNTEVIILLFPDLDHNWDAYPYTAIHKQVTILARANDFKVINLLDYFSAYPPRELRISDVDGHPNELAHTLTAQAILKYLER